MSLRKIFTLGGVGLSAILALWGTFTLGKVTATEEDVKRTLVKRTINIMLKEKDIPAHERKLIKQNRKMYAQFLEHRLATDPSIIDKALPDVVEAKAFMDWMTMQAAAKRK